MSFGFNERIVTRANATLKAWEAVEYGAHPRNERARRAGVASNVYLNRGAQYPFRRDMTGRGEG